MKNARWIDTIVLFALMSSLSSQAADLDALISVNVRNAPIKGVLETIASKAGLHLIADQDLNTSVTLAQNGATARQLLDKLAAENQMEYTITGTKLFVDKTKAAGNSGGDAHEIVLRNALASELVLKFTPVIAGEGRLISDDRSNKLIYMGSKKMYEKLKSLTTYFDTPQKQIMIEAIIAETSHNFLQQIGVSMGNSGTAITGSVNTSGPSNPNGTFNAILGNVNSKALNLRLTAAESKGDAKIVSRPKVITLNNRAARVESGVTFNIKTLSNVSAGGTVVNVSNSASQGVVTGSVTSINALLSLDILPLIIGNDEIKLTVEINDSSPDLGAAVDGIPGILKNSANTAVILKNKQTAVIAGLIKQTKSKTTTGVPILSDIPILGWLFKSNSVADLNNELVIFLTPTIDESSKQPLTPPGIDPALLVHSVLDPVKEEEVPVSEKRAPASTPASEEDDE